MRWLFQERRTWPQQEPELSLGVPVPAVGQSLQMRCWAVHLPPRACALSSNSWDPQENQSGLYPVFCSLLKLVHVPTSSDTRETVVSSGEAMEGSSVCFKLCHHREFIRRDVSD